MKWLRKVKALLLAAQTKARERRIVSNGTIDDKLTLVLAAPLRWAQAPGRHPFVWPRHTTNGRYLPSDIYITIGGVQLAYIQRVVIDPIRNCAVIGHFAVERGFEGCGLGRAVAVAFRDAVAREYGVRRIIFSEDSPHYDAAGYARFFEALGAKGLHPSGHPSVPTGSGDGVDHVVADRHGPILRCHHGSPWSRFAPVS